MWTFASLLAAACLAGLSSASCLPNVCLNAIAKDPKGIADCCSYLLTTVILPTPTVTVFPSGVDVKVYTTTISSTETDFATVEYQPSSVIVLTYTSTYVVSSVTYTTTDQATTTLTTDFTATETTALHTSTSTSTTTTTTTTTTSAVKHPYAKRYQRPGAGAAPSPRKTIVPSKVPDHASMCHTSYSKVCLSAGGTASVTTVTPPTVTVTLSSTSVSTESVESTLYVSSTITLPSTETLPSLHSTTTLIVPSTDYTSTATVTSYISTETDVSDQILTATIQSTTTSTTTTTTTTLAVSTPTPFKCQVSSEHRTKQSTTDVSGKYLTHATSQQLSLNGNAGIVFASSTSDQFILDNKNNLVSLVGFVQYYLVVDSNSYVELVKTPSASATLVTCTASGSTLNCNYYLQLVSYKSGATNTKILGATLDSTADGVLVVKKA